MYETGGELRQISVRICFGKQVLSVLTIFDIGRSFVFTNFLLVYVFLFGTKTPGGNVANDAPDF